MTKATQKIPYKTLLAALLVALLYFLVHMHYMQQFLDSDQGVYINNIKRAIIPGNLPLYNPHHLHFEVGGKLFQQFMVDNFGDAGFTELTFNMRLRSLLAACFGLFFVVLFLKDTTGKLLWGILGGLLVGVCHGYLQYATKVDTSIFPTALFPAILWITGRLVTAKKWIILPAFLCGLFIFAGMMGHQYIAFLAVALGISLLAPGFIFKKLHIYKIFYIIRKKTVPKVDKSPGKRTLALAVIVLTSLITVVSAYFYAGKTEYNLQFDTPTPAKSHGIWRGILFQEWLFAYATADVWGKGIEKFNPLRPFRGYTDGFLSQPPDVHKYNFNKTFKYNTPEPLAPESFVHNQLAYYTLFVLAGMILLAPFLLRRYKRIYLILLISLVFYLVFFTYWEPHYYEFWLIPSLLMVLSGILILNYLGEQLSKLIKSRMQTPFYLYALILLITFGGHNLLNYIVPYSRVIRTWGVYRYLRNPWNNPLHYSLKVYKNPRNVYKTVYDTKPGRVMPDGSGRGLGMAKY